MNRIIKIVIIVVVAFLILGIIGSGYYFLFLRPIVKQGKALITWGIIKKNSDLYIIENTKSNYRYVINSFDPKIEKALSPLVDKFSVIYGVVEEGNNFLLLWLNGKMIVKEEEALNSLKKQSGSFTDVFGGLFPPIRDCINKVLGQDLINNLKNPLVGIPDDKTEAYSQCFQVK